MLTKWNKKNLLFTLVVAILFLYVGMALRTDHPNDQLYDAVTAKMNKAHVVSFKSGFAVNKYDKFKGEIREQWQFKRRGTYDAWSQFLHYKNLTHFEDLETSNKDEDEETSLTPKASGNMIALPTKEAYFKNGMYYEQNRASGLWATQEKHSFDLLELLPLNAELLNRYAKNYKSENRMRFVVYFYSIDPNYLTRTFPAILESHGLDFPIRFKEGTIKTLVYPDTNLPRRIYSIYLIENMKTGEVYEYNIDTYFSEDENYNGMDEPAIPETGLREREVRGK
jgi:hypothetical protein